MMIYLTVRNAEMFGGVDLGDRDYCCAVWPLRSQVQSIVARWVNNTVGACCKTSQLRPLTAFVAERIFTRLPTTVAGENSLRGKVNQAPK